MSLPKSKFRMLLTARHRLFVALVIGVVVCLAMYPSERPTAAIVAGWDAMTLYYLITTSHLIANSTADTCRARANLYDEGDWIILAMTLAGALISFGTIIAELAAGKAAGYSYLHIFSVTIGTVVLSWTFTHMIFALHYANLYYRTDASGSHGGLNFPGEHEPDYRDFIYYSFVIACAAQTADVSTISPAMRRVTLIHCITAFAFNSAILALMINITASLI